MVALVVGTVLNLINHFDLLLGAPVTATSLIQMALTYSVPYMVSTHAQIWWSDD
ncbi:MAG: nitrate/nitrite transporter NrtS [Casimicrobiaceae bacterium]